MKAAVCYEFGKPLVIEEVSLDPPQTGEVKVRLAATGICHSDVHFIRGEWGGELPVIAGHEAAGVVEEVGANVTLTKPGDAVVVSLLRSCGRCFYCVTGAPNHCEATWPLETETRIRNQRRDPILHGVRVASFAEYVIVDQSQAIPIPIDMPLDRAALLACAVITGLGAVVNTAKVEPGSSVVVIGTGGVGLNAIQGAALAGAYPIIAVDLLDTKLTAAQTFGATHTINSGRETAVEVVQQLTSGRGADYVFVTVGSEAAMTESLKMIRKRGTVVMVGLPGHKATVPLAAFKFVAEEARIMGSFMGATRLSVEIPRLVNLYLQGRLKLDELITARYRLDQINEAIETMEQGKALRNVIVF